jgi:CHAD domain-containing protein
VARAHKVELDCSASFALAAVQTVEIRAAEVFEHSKGVLDLDDVERVHDMRVATRRLRAALEVFEVCFPPKRHRKALKRVKALADALGERRDLDVEIELLEGFANPGRNAVSGYDADNALHQDDGAALATMIEEMRQRQRRANQELAPFVKSKRLKKLRRRLAELVKEVDK